MSDDPKPNSKSQEHLPTRPTRHIWSIPPPLKRLFDHFPLVTYPPNDLPSRSVTIPHRAGRADIHAFYDAHTTKRSSAGQKEEALHALFSWASMGDESPTIASFNPKCLKWQAYLIFQGIKLHVIPSNNHASFPSSLPLLASHPEAGPPFVQPLITSEGLQKWAKKTSVQSIQEDAFMSLVDGPVRRAWLYSMYLTPNFEKITVHCYINNQSTSPIIQTFSARELRNAAREELLKYRPVIDESAIYLEAEQALKALAEYVTGHIESDQKPTSVLDATVFAYTYLLLELEHRVWADKRLINIVRKFDGLRKHKDAIRKNHFRARPPSLWKQLNKEHLPTEGET